ncbi:hypothetical protein [Geodermatophilus sp. SYSU D00684]
MATWLGSIRAEDSGNWDICKREGLFGSDRLAALKVRAGDDIVVWGARRGWLGRLRATADAHPPARLADVPWSEPKRYEALIPMRVVDEPTSPVWMDGEEFMAVAGVHTVQIRNFERLAGDRAAEIVALIGGRAPAREIEDGAPAEAQGADGPLKAELLASIDALRVDRQLGRPARYQHLVLLWAISRAVRGHERMQAYSTAREELSRLMAPFAVGQTRPDPALAWYALRACRWWRLIGVPDVPEARGREVVRRSDPAGGLTFEAEQLVVGDETFRRRAIARLARAIDGHPAAAATMSALFDPAPTGPKEHVSEAERLLSELVGKTVTTAGGAVDRVLALRPPHVLVGTERSPGGRPVPIADVQLGLDLMRLHGAVSIDVDTLGHRSSFVGAVLASRSDVAVSGTPPVAVLVADSEGPEPWDPTFDGATSVMRTVEARREQRRLRATLFGVDSVRACALCGDEFPVAFLRAAHIKPRYACSDEERRQLHRIAMPACVFGCDALFEAGFVGVDEDGTLILSGDVHADGTLSRRAGALVGRRCDEHSPLTADLFRWHREHVLRDRRT